MNRRHFALGLAAAAAGTGALKATAEQGQSSQAELEPDDLLEAVLNEIEALGEGPIESLVLERVIQPDRSILQITSLAPKFDVPPITPDLIANLKAKTYFDIPEADRPLPFWPTQERAPDYLHLANFAPPPKSLVLTPELLAFLADRNSFPVDSAGDLVVFGLRGCRISKDPSVYEWQNEVALTLDTPTHLAPRCVIGIWRRSDNMIAVFPGSTVPAAHNMFSSLMLQGAGTSLLPTGFYSYVRGNHKASKPKSIQRGALLVQGQYPVLRTARDLAFDPFSETTAWTLGTAHNIHAAGMSDVFDSAGCQVIRGRYIKPARTEAEGPWKTFRQLVGTVAPEGPEPTPQSQSKFRYMLLTGLEAALAFSGGNDFVAGYRPLRIGSSGPSVSAFQNALIEKHGTRIFSRADGDFGPRTAFGVLAASRKLYGDYASSIAPDGAY